MKWTIGAGLHLVSNGSFLLAAASAACSKSVISRSVRQSRVFTTSSAPTMVLLGRCACLCHSCSLTVEWAHDSKDECERSLWRVLRLSNGSPGPVRERASSRHTDQSGALISLVLIRFRGKAHVGQP